MDKGWGDPKRKSPETFMGADILLVLAGARIGNPAGAANTFRLSRQIHLTSGDKYRYFWWRHWRVVWILLEPETGFQSTGQP